jgi:L-lactate dehydrogenase
MLPDQNIQTIKIAVIGADCVGAAFAYALLQSGLASEIVLIDQHQDKAEAEALDLNHAVPLHSPMKVWAGSVADCAGAAITVVTVGEHSNPGETQLELIKRKTDLFRAIIPQIALVNPDGLMLIASDPVDLLTFAAWKLCGLPAKHVIGLGTILETARFRHLLGAYFKTGARSVHAYIIGEQGSAAIPVWSQANIDGMLLSEYSHQYGISYSEAALQEIFHQARDAAGEIIRRKGASAFASAAGLLQIVEAILLDKSTVLTVSSYIEDNYQISGVYLSQPTNIGRGGVEWVLRLDLSQDEILSLRHCADSLKETIGRLDI